MATISVVVNTAGGGDYTSLNAARAALAQDLTSVTPDVADVDGNTTIALRIGVTGGVDTTQCVFGSEFTTDATHRVQIYTIGGGSGPKWDTSKYRLVASAGYKAGTLVVGAALHMDLVDLQVEAGDAVSNAPIALRFSDYAFDVRVVGGMYRQTGTTGSWDNASVIRNMAGTAAYQLRLRNVTAVAADGPAVVAEGYNTASPTALFYNCTLVNRGGTSRDVFNYQQGSSSTLRAKNLVVQGTGSSNYTFGDGAEEQLTILTQDTTGTSGLQSKTLTFVDAANWDYHLASGDTDAIGAGTDLHADSYWPFSTDGDGQSRPNGAWDVGADQYASSYVPPVQEFVKVLFRAP